MCLNVIHRDTNELANDHTDAEGKLHYGGNKTALLGSYANYSNDRIVFYDNDNVGNIVRAYVRYISSIFANVN